MRLFILLLLIPFGLKAQQLNGTQLLEKAINYHDPNGEWDTFKGTLFVEMTTPDRSARMTEIYIDLPGSFFQAVAKQDDIKTTYTVKNGNCAVNTEPPQEKNPDCERAVMYRNYYTYLYGLPMKLKDPGTIIDPKVEMVTFKGKEYLRLKASYTEEVGSDVWFFYFDPQTYALQVYQFYKGDPNGKGKETGEYILLEGESLIGGMRIPKDREWFYNKDDKFLGKDALKN